MPRKLFFIFLFGLNLFKGYAQNFPKLGNDTLLDVACWNTEWLGDISNGPTDEALQYTNVLALLDKTGMDVFAVEEISNAGTYNSLSTALATTYDTYISTFSQTQKMAIYWRKSMFNVIYANSYNIPLNSTDNQYFASRPPLQVCLQTKGGTKTDTIFFLVLHMKAYADVDSYNRRVGASAALKSYVETNLAGKKFIVLGDWNDDLDQSIYNASVSPYKNFLDAGYTFPSKELTVAGKSSYAFNTNMIDHILDSKTLDSFYYKTSARVFDAAPTYCSGFSNNTSDHYPVYAFYNWKKLTTRLIPSGIEEMHQAVNVEIYPNPMHTGFTLHCDREVSSFKITDIQGKIVFESYKSLTSDSTSHVDMSSFENGIYFIQIQTENGIVVSRILKQ